MQRSVDAYGRVTFAPEDAFELLYAGIDIRKVIAAEDGLIAAYNRSCLLYDKQVALIVPQPAPQEPPEAAHARRASAWAIPPEMVSLDVQALLLGLCETDAQRDRVSMEMAMFEARDLVPMLRMVIALVAHFRRNKVVWGVGRGSSVASYVLFLLGLHKVDSLAYGLDIAEFLK